MATWLSYAGYYFCRKTFSVAKSTLQRDLHLDTTALAHVWTAFLVAYMLGQFLSGELGARRGPRVLLLAGMAVSLGCNVAFGFANGFGTFLGFMVLNGVAQATGWPGNVAAMAPWFGRRERGTVMGLWSTCYQLGSVAAKAFAAFLLGWVGWRWSFWGASLVLGAVWLVFLVLQRNRPEDVGLAALDDERPIVVVPGDAAKRGRAASGFFGILFNRTVLVMGVAYFCFKFLRYAVDSWLPYFLDAVYHLPASRAGYASTVFDLMGFGGSLCAGYFSDRLFAGRRAAVMVLMSVGMTVAYLLLFRLGGAGIPVLITLYGLIGFFLFGPDTLLAGAGAIDVGSRRDAAAAAGIINGLGSIGPIFQEQLVARVYQSSGGSLTGVNSMMLGVSAAGTLALAFLWWRGRGDAARAV